MPLYYFDIHDHLDLMDDVGTELASLDAARVEAVRLAGEMLKDTASLFETGVEWRLDVSDHTRLLLFSLTFLVVEPSPPQQS